VSVWRLFDSGSAEVIERRQTMLPKMLCPQLVRGREKSWQPGGRPVAEVMIFEKK